MTTKYLKLFTISTLISYFILITFTSDIGFSKYSTIKKDISKQKLEVSQLYNEVNGLKLFKENLERGEYVLDNAFELGYINEGDSIFNLNTSAKNELSTSIKEESKEEIIKYPLLYKWEMRYFLYLSMVIGLVTTTLFSVISLKMKEKRNIDD